MSPYRTPATRDPIDIYIEPMPRRRMPALSRLSALAAMALALPLIQAIPACIEKPAEVAAAAGYEAQQMRCVEQYAKRADIDRCRAKVKLAWLTDAGTDASDGGDQ